MTFFSMINTEEVQDDDGPDDMPRWREDEICESRVRCEEYTIDKAGNPVIFYRYWFE